MRRMFSKPQLLEAVEEESKINGIKVFEDIKDKDGHNRFIEGDIILLNTITAGVTITYKKWSLSGTHIMIVLAGDIENGAVLADVNWAEFALPDWIMDKISTIFSNVIDIKAINARDAAWTTQTLSFALKKITADGVLRIEQFGTLTLTSAKGFRLQFDLLIDNE